MTDKEMHKLSRRELLQLLLAQVSETEDLKSRLAERDEQLTELRGNYEKLRKRLDQKDAKIHELRDTLREERTTRRIELEEAGSIAEAALRLNGIFDMAQKAADQYLENVKRLYEGDPSDSEIRERLDDIEEEDGWELPEKPGERPPAEEPADGAGEKPEAEGCLEQADELEELLAEQVQSSAEDLLEESVQSSEEGLSEEQAQCFEELPGEQLQESEEWLLTEPPPEESGEDEWAELPEGRDDVWAELPEAEEDIWAEAPEDGSGEAAAAEVLEDRYGEAAGAEAPEIGEGAPMEFMEQDGQRGLWEEKGKKKRKSRWRRRALSR